MLAMKNRGHFGAGIVGCRMDTQLKPNIAQKICGKKSI